MTNEMALGIGNAKVIGTNGVSYLISFNNESFDSILARAAAFYGVPMSHVYNVRFLNVSK